MSANLSMTLGRVSKSLVFVGCALLWVCATTSPASAAYESESGAAPATMTLDTQALAAVLIQHEGRVKPLDSFARHIVLSLYQQSSLPDRSAIDFAAVLLTEPEVGYDIPVVRIRNPEVLAALKIDSNVSKTYSLRTVRDGLGPMESMLHRLHRRDKAERTAVENRLVEIFLTVRRSLEFSRSFSALRKDLVIENAALAARFGLKSGEATNYLHFANKREVFNTLSKDLEADPKAHAAEMPGLQALAIQLNGRLADEGSRLLAIIPPADGDLIDGQWDSPWALFDGRPLEGETLKTLSLLQDAVAAAQGGDAAAWTAGLNTFNTLVAGHAPDAASGVGMELFYNQADLFYWSIALYIIAFLMLCLSWMFAPKLLWRVAFTLFALGFVPHTAGLVLRMVVMGRPPVSTLYESIIFVGWVAAFACLFVEKARRNGLGLLTGTVVGAGCHFIGFSYAADGDTMGMLVAVLDSNFWLATHVVTITIGYGTTLVAGVIGHIYLVKRAFRPHDKKALRAITRNGLGVSLVAIFFAVLGTILGGIWADQSWGRFWGWDPKENGAMLICLWLLILLHGRIGGQLKDLGFAVGLVLGNITVAAAWFGVNLLAVGLHAYGFTDSIAYNLLLFCVFELVFGFGLYAVIKWREKGGKPKPPAPTKPRINVAAQAATGSDS